MSEECPCIVCRMGLTWADEIKEAIVIAEWINVKDRKPEVGQLVVGWLSRHQEPACLRYEADDYWRELVMFDPDEDREDKVSHWFPLPGSPHE